MSTWTKLSNVGRMVVLVASREGEILVCGREGHVLVAEACVGEAEAGGALGMVLYYADVYDIEPCSILQCANIAFIFSHNNQQSSHIAIKTHRCSGVTR